MRTWLTVAIALVVGVMGFFAGRTGPVAVLRTTGQYDLMEGWGLIHQANRVLAHHTDRQDAIAWGYQGVAYVQAAQGALAPLGVSEITPVYLAVQPAEEDLLTGRETTRDAKTLKAFYRALQPYAGTGYGEIPDPKLQAALRDVMRSSP